MVEFCFGEAEGHDDEVDEGEERPDGAEEEEADLRGGAGVPVVVPPVGDWEERRVLVGGGWDGGWEEVGFTVGCEAEDDD